MAAVGEIWVAERQRRARLLEQARRRPPTTFSAFIVGHGEGPYLRTGDLGVHRRRPALRDRTDQGRPDRPRREALPAGHRSHRRARAPCGAAGLLRCVRGRPATAKSGSRWSPRSKRGTSREPTELASGDRVDSPLGCRAHQVAPCAVALVPAGTLPKTTSGKLQRFLCRDGSLARRVRSCSRRGPRRQRSDAVAS